MSLLVALIAMHAGQYDRQGNERLLEQRAHQDAGEESPFTLPSETLSAESTAEKPKHQTSPHHVPEII